MVAINNTTTEFKKIDEKFLKNVVKKILLKEKISAKINLSIALVDAGEIKKINKQYRRENSPTDVLSFGELIEKKQKPEYFSESEIIICPSVVQKNAKQAKELFEKELARVLAHAMLHLLGYEHEEGGVEAKKMFQKQEEYLSLFNFNTKKINNN
ncbi:MAG: rRNA maturation RNase YbeY [Candidatus Paceibacterota bacterium]